MFAILITKDGKSWLLLHAYAGVALFGSQKDAAAHIESIRATGIEYQLVLLHMEKA